MAHEADVWKSAKLDTTSLPPTTSASASGLPLSVNLQTLLTTRQHSQSPASTTPTHQEEQYVSEEAPDLDDELYKDAETITGTSADFVNFTKCCFVAMEPSDLLGSGVLTVCVIQME